VVLVLGRQRLGGEPGDRWWLYDLARDRMDRRDALPGEGLRDLGYAALRLITRFQSKAGMVELPRLPRCSVDARYQAVTSVRAVATTSATRVVRCSDELVSGCRMQARSVSRASKTVPVPKARPRD
jgi:hypothetical protein